METQHINTPEALFLPYDCFEFDSQCQDPPVRDQKHYYTEFLQVAEGVCRITIGGKVHVLQPGSGVCIASFRPHTIENGNAEHFVVRVVRLDPLLFGVLPTISHTLYSLISNVEAQHVPISFTPEEAEQYGLTRLFEECMKEWQTKEIAYDLRVHGLISLLLSGMIRIWLAHGYTPQQTDPDISPIDTIPAYVQRHIREPLKVEHLAELCDMSYPWFAKKFRDRFGISCKEYIRQVRIRQVEHYLDYTDCDLHFISRVTGYADCSHMIKDFRQFWNITPRQYRQSRRSHQRAECFRVQVDQKA